MDLIQQICSEKNLQEAWIKAQHFALNNSPYFDSTDYDQYSRYPKENFLILRSEIVDGTYKPYPFRQVEISKSNGEKRKMYFASAKDTLAMMAIINIVGPIFEQKMYIASYGYRIAYGDETNKSAFKRWQDQYKQYIKRARSFLSLPAASHYFMTDIRNFYPKIDKHILLEKLHRYINSEVVKIIESLLYSESINLFGNKEQVIGVPTGTPIAPLLANIYLTDLDFVISNMTENYVRYVDDIILSGHDKPSTHMIATALNAELAKLHLESNIVKTSEQPISIQESHVLLEHTQKMHYDQKFEAVRDISLEHQREANQIFSEIFLAVENDGEIKNLSSSSASLAVRFFERNQLDNLQNITLTFLEAGMVKPATLRVIMGTQLRIADKTSISFRFRDFLLGCNDTEKLAFLKILSEFEALSKHEIVKPILQQWLQSENYLVRSGVYETIGSFNNSHNFSSLTHDLVNEPNPYVKAKIIGCLGREFLEFDLTILLNLINLNEPIVASAIFWLIESFWHDSIDKDVIYSNLLIELAKRQVSTELNAWCQRLLLQKSRPEWKQSFNLINKNISNILFEYSLSQTGFNGDDFLLINSSNEVQDFSQPVGDSKYEMLKTISPETLQSNLSPVTIPGFNYDYTQTNYGHLSDPPEYKCLILEGADGRRATIEYMHINRILSNIAFPSVQSWWMYLERLEESGIVSIIDKGALSETIVYCVYDIPSDSQTLFDTIQNKQANHDQLDSFRVLRSMALATKISEDNGFRFDGIVPQNIVLSGSNGPCKFLNIGFGLSVPNHNCSQPNCRHYQEKPELGRTTGLYFAGLSILELNLKICPLEELKKVKSESEPDGRLANILKHLDLGPHMRSIIVRLIQSEPTWRYQTLSAFNEDLEHIALYRQRLIDLKTKLTSEELDKFTFLDYILFKYGVSLRNPNFADGKKSTLEKTIYIINYISNNILYLDEKYQVAFRYAVKHATFKSMRIYGVSLRNMSPEARYLLRIAAAWINIVTEMQSVISLEIYPIDRLLVFNAIYVELSRYSQAAAFRSFFNKTLADFSWCGDINDNIKKVTFQLGSQSTPIITKYTKSSLREALQISRYYEEGSQSFLKPVTTINSLTAFLTLNILGYANHQANNGTLKIETQSEIEFQTCTAVINNAADIENKIYLHINEKNIVPTMSHSDWADVSSLIQALPKIVNLTRKTGTLIHYDLLQQRGTLKTRILLNVRKGQLFSDQREFHVPRTLILGNISKSSKKQRHIETDFVKIDSRDHLVSILSRPNLFLNLLLIKDSRIYSFLSTIRANPVKSRIVMSAFFIFLLLSASLIEVISPTMSYLLLFVTVPVQAAWEPVYILIDQILLPEQTKDV